MRKFALIVFVMATIIGCKKDDAVIIEETGGDLCISPTNLTVSDLGHSQVSVFWNSNNSFSFTLEYGESGFQLGAGTRITEITSQDITIDGLSSDTSYDFYVKGRCNNNVFSEYSLVRQFTTLLCPAITPNSVNNITAESANFRWFYNDSGLFQVELGEAGFTLGTGFIDQTTAINYNFTGLNPGTAYDVYVKSICGTNSSDYSQLTQFTTLTDCNIPEDLAWTEITSSSIKLFWRANGESSWQIQYGPVGFPIGTGTVINTSNRNYRISSLSGGTTYEIYVRANCGSDGYSVYTDSLVVTTL